VEIGYTLSAITHSPLRNSAYKLGFRSRVSIKSASGSPSTELLPKITPTISVSERNVYNHTNAHFRWGQQTDKPLQSTWV